MAVVSWSHFYFGLSLGFSFTATTLGRGLEAFFGDSIIRVIARVIVRSLLLLSRRTFFLSFFSLRGIYSVFSAKRLSLSCSSYRRIFSRKLASFFFKWLIKSYLYFYIFAKLCTAQLLFSDSKISNIISLLFWYLNLRRFSIKLLTCS